MKDRTRNAVIITGTVAGACLLLFGLTMLVSRVLAGSIIIGVVVFGSPLFFLITCAAVWIVARRQASVPRKIALVTVNALGALLSLYFASWIWTLLKWASFQMT